MSDKPKYRYPGWDLDVDWERHTFNGSNGYIQYPIANSSETEGFCQMSEMICVREVSMMLAMDRISDKPDWHIKVFDDDMAAKWREEITAWRDDDLWNLIADTTRLQPWWLRPPAPGDDRDGNANLRPEEILNDAAADCCILELRDKAEYFKRTGIVPTLDASYTVVKSDVLVPASLREAIREAFAQLQADQATCHGPDWYPNTNQTVQNLVDPSKYPLAYGRSRFFPNEVVGIFDAVDKWAGKGDVIPSLPSLPSQEPWHSRRPIDQTWSTQYQWLPANLEFTPSGGVRFTSYINNLHPTKYRHMYATIEKLVETALPLWDQCLVEFPGCGYSNPLTIAPGRTQPRLNPEGLKDDSNGDNWDPPSMEDMLARKRQGNVALGDNQVQEPLEPVQGKSGHWEEWVATRKPVQIPVFGHSKVDYTPEDTLRQRFKDSGLQIMVKMTSIELTPEKPEFPPGPWHAEGLGYMNERIVATALYYLDSENVTESHIEFRAETFSDAPNNSAQAQTSFSWMEYMYGVKLGGDDTGGDDTSPSLQKYGSVVTREGRLLAFPNIFHHRVSGFRLADASRPGHHRFIALWLVNPTVRIINTGNIPPQQGEWWGESAFGPLRNNGGTTSLPADIAILLLQRGLGKGHIDTLLERGELGGQRLPNELLDMVATEISEGLPMSCEEAEEHRLGIIKERSSPWPNSYYYYCYPYN
ncbi:hypothetical protein QBC39DRAFT_148702 [Podospora conica]|nr:hypothetical protein QBC39DRAFT_148702 [Schizothecium conicum]